MSQSSSTKIVEHALYLKYKITVTQNPARKRHLQKVVDRLLDNENARLTRLINESVERIDKQLEEFDLRQKDLDKSIFIILIIVALFQTK